MRSFDTARDCEDYKDAMIATTAESSIKYKEKLEELGLDPESAVGNWLSGRCLPFGALNLSMEALRP